MFNTQEQTEEPEEKTRKESLDTLECDNISTFIFKHPSYSTTVD